MNSSDKLAEGNYVGSALSFGVSLLDLFTLGAANKYKIGSVAVVLGVERIIVTNTAKSQRLNHIFGNPEHSLEILVKKFSSKEKALKAGELNPNAKGILPKVGKMLNVNGINVNMIGGLVKDGKVIISSLSRKGL